MLRKISTSRNKMLSWRRKYNIRHLSLLSSTKDATYLKETPKICSKPSIIRDKLILEKISWLNSWRTPINIMKKCWRSWRKIRNSWAKKYPSYSSTSTLKNKLTRKFELASVKRKAKPTNSRILLPISWNKNKMPSKAIFKEVKPSCPWKLLCTSWEKILNLFLNKITKMLKIYRLRKISIKNYKQLSKNWKAIKKMRKVGIWRPMTFSGKNRRILSTSKIQSNVLSWNTKKWSRNTNKKSNNYKANLKPRPTSISSKPSSTVTKSSTWRVNSKRKVRPWQFLKINYHN